MLAVDEPAPRTVSDGPSAGPRREASSVRPL